MRNFLRDNSTHIRYPSQIDVHEHKAPTDESIRIMEEAHDKAIKNIIAKVKVENNLVTGECFCVDQPWSINDLKLCFRFKINGTDFMVEKEISRFELGVGDLKEISIVAQKVEDMAKSLMLWYALKMFTAVAYEQITNQKVPDYLLK